MAAISNVVDEFITIGDAHPAINGTDYFNDHEVKPVNVETKPLLQIVKQRQFNFDFSNDRKQFNITLRIIDKHTLSDRNSEDWQDKQEEMAEWLREILQEYRDRTIGETDEVTSTQNWFTPSGALDTVSAEFIEHWGDQNYAAIEATIPVWVDMDCDKPNFSY